MPRSMVVDPIKRIEDIRAIKRLLVSRPRDHLLFVMGINSGLRVGDLLRLKVGQVEGLKVGGMLEIRESKTGKRNFLLLNKEIGKALNLHLQSGLHSPEAYLFGSRKGGKPLTLSTVNRLVKSWAAAINLPGNYGGRTLRKTFGYIQRVHFGVGFEILCKRYNHSNPSVTMRYIGVQPEEVTSIMMHEI
ncbi:tyrosine-type recombinase/integrase [Desulfovibrio caledoniensis]